MFTATRLLLTAYLFFSYNLGLNTTSFEPTVHVAQCHGDIDKIDVHFHGGGECSNQRQSNNPAFQMSLEIGFLPLLLPSALQRLGFTTCLIASSKVRKLTTIGNDCFWTDRAHHAHSLFDFFTSPTSHFSLLNPNHKDALKHSLNDQLCAQISQVINDQLNKVLSTLPTDVPLDEYAGLNYQLTAAPLTTPNYGLITSKGQFYILNQPSLTPPFPPPQLPTPTAYDRMFYFYVTPYTVETAGWAYSASGRLNYTILPSMVSRGYGLCCTGNKKASIITDCALLSPNPLSHCYSQTQVPSGFPVQLNTNSLGVIIPQLKKMYPNMSMEVTIVPAAMPFTVVVGLKEKEFADNDTVSLVTPSYFYLLTYDQQATPAGVNASIDIYMTACTKPARCCFFSASFEQGGDPDSFCIFLDVPSHIPCSRCDPAQHDYSPRLHFEHHRQHCCPSLGLGSRPGRVRAG